MHDLKEIRSNPDSYKESLSKRDKDLPGLIDELLETDKNKREIQTKADELRKKKNEIAEQIRQYALMAKQQNKTLIEITEKAAKDILEESKSCKDN